MSHFNEAEFIDFLDGTLDAVRARHVDSCTSCRQQADVLRGTLAKAEESEQPEPSPLFWDHFSSNVRRAIENDAAPAPLWRLWLRRPGRIVTAAASLATVVFAVVLWHASSARPPAPVVSVVPAQATEASGNIKNGWLESAMIDADVDEAWAVVRSVADQVPWDETREVGLTAKPGSIERAALELTPEERHELARLLETELRRKGA